MNNKIVFITNSLSQPRVIKRITSLYNAGLEVVVYGYKRESYNCNSLPDNIPLLVLGKQNSGRSYLYKIIQNTKDVDRIINLHVNEDVLYYSFSFFVSVLLRFRKVKYIYEISDIFYGYRKFCFIRWLIKIIDKNVIKFSILTVMTSGGFEKYFFNNRKNKNIIVQPNKLNSFYINYKRTPTFFLTKSSLIFSYIGAIRYPNTIFRFARIIGEKFPEHRFDFYGESIYTPLCVDLANKFANITYRGAYKNPDDLSSIYSKIDVVVACYETESLNERIAEPNKLYESIFFGKPIVVSKKIYLSEQVDKYKCGFAIDAYSDNEIINFVKKLSVDNLNEISLHDLNISSEKLIDNPGEIISFIRSI